MTVRWQRDFAHHAAGVARPQDETCRVAIKVLKAVPRVPKTNAIGDDTVDESRTVVGDG